MARTAASIAPVSVIRLVDAHIEKELLDAQKFHNREVLDESGCFSLHRLAAEIWSMGFEEGQTAESERQRGVRQREKDRAEHAAHQRMLTPLGAKESTS